MKKSKSKQNFHEHLQLRIQKELKHYKRKRFFIKLKLGLLIVLPAILALLTAKTAEVWLGLKLRDVKLPDAQPLIQSVQQEVMKNDFITPEPVNNTGNTKV